MAAAQGLSPASIHRIWHVHGLQPHRVRTFKLSTDPRFIEKLTDVVGLYVDPPEKALVFCVDEKSQIQALQRSQPGLPMKPGRTGTMTHDYKRHGTTTLFAALNVLEGTVIGSCLARHRHQEFRKFLNLLDAQTPPDVAIHAIVDNYATHKHPAIQRWLRRHPRFHLHFVPTSRVKSPLSARVTPVECFWVSPRAARARGRHLLCYSEIGIESKGVSLCTQNS